MSTPQTPAPQQPQPRPAAPEGGQEHPTLPLPTQAAQAAQPGQPVGGARPDAPTAPLAPVPQPPAAPAAAPVPPAAPVAQPAFAPPQHVAMPQGPQGPQGPHGSHAPQAAPGYPAPHQPHHGAAFGAPAPTSPYALPTPPAGGGHGGAHGGPGDGATGATGDGARRRGPWVPVVSAAAAAAVVASLGTAALTGAFTRDGSEPTDLASVGQQQEQPESDNVPVKSSTSTNPDWEAVTTAVAPSVVSIQVASQSGSAEGSGVVIDAKGYVLTNNHVVEGAQDDTVQVTLSDGRLFEATIVGTDPTTDLAVVQLKDAPNDLQAATLGDSDDVKVGEAVLAVGNPLGLANTATTGIVSALDRPVSASGEDGSTSVVTNAIQIDAAINPGNSGGPLFDAQGRVIGITSSIASLSSGSGQSGSIGLGFAIPVNLAKNISSQLVENGTAQHAFLGVSLTDATATADGVTRRGAKVEQVTDGSPAAEAGVRTGDVIVAIDGDAVSGAESLTAYVRERAAGEKVTVTIVRDGSAEDLTVTLAVKSEDTSSQQGQQQGQQGDGSGQQGDGSGQQGQQPGQQGGSGDQTNPNNVPNPFDWFFGGQG